MPETLAIGFGPPAVSFDVVALAEATSDLHDIVVDLDNGGVLRVLRKWREFGSRWLAFGLRCREVLVGGLLRGTVTAPLQRDVVVFVALDLSFTVSWPGSRTVAGVPCSRQVCWDRAWNAGS